jgi:hypothetical protein
VVGDISPQRSLRGIADSSTLALSGNFARPIHYHGVLASFPAIHLKLYSPPALSAMPVWQNLPLYRLLGLPQDE